jgi:hypothetical protein
MPFPRAFKPFEIRFEDYIDQASENAGEPNACADDDIVLTLTSPIFADPNNWEWSPRSRATWELAEEPWQAFRDRWYGAEPTAAYCASLVDPKSPCLSLEPLHPYLNDFPPSILVRESYVTTFESVWARALSSRGHTGVIVNGQPGTGAHLPSYLLYYKSH